MPGIYFDDSLVIGQNSINGIIAGVVDTYAQLPAASSYTSRLYLVRQNSGITVSTTGFWQYPRGLYYSNGSTWELTPIQVKIAEDAQTLVNIVSAQWANFVNTGVDANINDHLVYEGKLYVNLTGTITTTNPSVDTTNWAQINASDIALTSTKFNATNVSDGLDEADDNAIAYAIALGG